MLTFFRHSLHSRKVGLCRSLVQSNSLYYNTLYVNAQ
nr:MAG TPA: hypothetical protein [Caudoviricetes sp.]